MWTIVLLSTLVTLPKAWLSWQPHLFSPALLLLTRACMPAPTYHCLPLSSPSFYRLSPTHPWFFSLTSYWVSLYDFLLGALTMALLLAPQIAMFVLWELHGEGRALRKTGSGESRIIMTPPRVTRVSSSSGRTCFQSNTRLGLINDQWKQDLIKYFTF